MRPPQGGAAGGLAQIGARGRDGDPTARSAPILNLGIDLLPERTPETDELLRAIYSLSPSDRHVVLRIIQRLAEIEDQEGVEAAEDAIRTLWRILIG